MSDIGRQIEQGSDGPEWEQYRRAGMDSAGLAWMRSCDELTKECFRHKAEIERLRAIVDRLPKTADGVPMVPGLRVWIWFVGGKITEAVHSGTDPKQSYWGSALWCYSTKEAAEEAKRRVSGE
jgi:hypothetical protein